MCDYDTVTPARVNQLVGDRKYSLDELSKKPRTHFISVRE